MAVVTVDIGTTGRTRATVTLWESNSYNTTGSDNAVGEMYDDSVFDEDALINDTTPIDIKLTVPAAERGDGTAGTGVRFSQSAGNQVEIAGALGTITCEWFEIDGNNIAEFNLFKGNSINSGTVVTLNNLIIHDVTNTAGIARGIYMGTAREALIMNTIIYDCIQNRNTGGEQIAVIVDHGAANSGVLNCVIHNTKQIHASATGAVYGLDIADVNTGYGVVNTIITDTTTAGSGTVRDFRQNSPTTIDMDHNLSSDTSASGTGSLTEKAAVDQFVSTAGDSEDLHLKAGADAIDAGADLGTTPSGVEIDINGRDRDAEGDTTDMGAHELVVVAAGIEILRRRREGY